MPHQFDTTHHDTPHPSKDSVKAHVEHLQADSISTTTLIPSISRQQGAKKELVTDTLISISDLAKKENYLFKKWQLEPIFFHFDEFKTLSDTTISATDTTITQTPKTTVRARALTGKDGNPMTQSILTNPIIPISLFVLFLLFLYTLTHGKKVIGETLKEFFFLKVRSSIFFETSANLTALRNSFVILFIGSVSLFLFTIVSKSNTELPIAYLGIITLGLLLFLGLKLLLFKFLGYVFFSPDHTEVFTRGYFTIFFALGLVLIPINIALIYSPQIFHTTIVILGFLSFTATFLLILYKIIQIFLSGITSLFYIMLYLCTLEILPILIVLRIIG